MKPPTKRKRPRATSQAAAETRAALNRTQAVKMRVEGKTLREIGEALGVSHKTVHEYIKEELARCRRETAGECDQLRELVRARLETVHQRMMALATRADIIIETEKDGVRGPITITVEDYQSATKAADAVVKINTCIANLYGLNAPVKQEVGNPGDFDTASKIRERLAKMNERNARQKATPDTLP